MIPLLLVLAAQSLSPPRAPHAEALELYRQHDYARAAAAFQKALETEKEGSAERGESVLLLGQCLYLEGNPSAAIPFLEKSPKTDEVLYMLANSYVRLRELKKAESALAALYGLEAASAGARLVTAQLLMRNDMEVEAEKELREAIAQDPKLPQAHFILGEIAMAKPALDESIALLKQEASINPNYAMVYYRLGDAYSRKLEWANSIAYLQKSVWLNPDFSGPYILLGKAYLKTQRLPDAEGVLRHAIDLDPKNYAAHYLLGQTLMQAGKTEEGRKMLQEYQNLRPQK